MPNPLQGVISYLKNALGEIINPAKEDGNLADIKSSIEELSKNTNPGNSICGDQGPLQQHEKESPNYPVREILTFDTLLHALLGSQDLTNKGRVRVESVIPSPTIVYGRMSRANDEVMITLNGHGVVGIQLIKLRGQEWPLNFF